MEFRLYRPEDFAEVYAIEERCFEPPLRFSRAYLRQALRRPQGAAWIAQDGQRLCGFVIAEWVRAEDEAAAYLLTLEVLAEDRGKGAGRALLQHAEDSARTAGAATIWLHVDAQNAVAVSLYEAAGYTLKGEEEDYYGRGRAALVYTRRLPRT